MTAVVGLLGSAVREIVAGARVDVDASAPTQEQFRETFRRLVACARKDKHYERLVFFIDELDRCSPEQVVKVLAAVRHFFDQPNCVFVIAADREVIERAAQEKAEQATPLNTENPYYSSASAYIDKIFQHQLALPPLRGRRLTRFARDLVEAKGSGLWAELAKIDNGRLRDQLFYILVPSHVRSPRRVKVLLNNFATSYRIAQSRGVDAVKNATAIAKLSALRTEFPLFAADLVTEPRLPALLFSKPANPSPRVAELLERHRLPDPAKKDDDKNLTETDAVLTDASNEDKDRLRLSERTLLRRYLVRTNQFANPSRDLLFLEPAGAAVDLEDEAFGELLETASIEEPARVVAAAQEQSGDEQRKALRVLADMVSQEFGQERTNVVTALLGVARHLGYDVAPHGPEILGALKVQLNEQTFESGLLAPTLAVALKAEDRDRTLSQAILGDPRLMEDATQTEAVAMVAGDMTKDQRERVWDKVVEFYPDNPSILDEPVSQLPGNVVAELVAFPSFTKAMRTHWNALTADAAAQEIDALLQRMADRSDESEEMRGALLLRLPDDLGNGYAALLHHESDLSAFSARPGFRTMIALKAIRLGPVTDWQTWSRHLQPVAKSWSSQPKRATDAAAAVLERWSQAAGIEDQAATTLAKVAALIPPSADADFAAAASTSTQAALGNAQWWATDPAATAQIRLHRALLVLQAVGPQTQAAMSELVVSDIERSFVPPPNALSFAAARNCAEGLEVTNLRRLAKSVAALSPQPPDLLADFGLARLDIARAGLGKGEVVQSPPFVITGDDAIGLLATAGRAEVLDGWYSLGPDFASGLKVAQALGPSAPASERAPVARWAVSVTAEERTDLMLGLSALANDTSDWVGDLSREPVEEERFVVELDARIRAATRGEDRADLARSIAALRPGRPAAQRAVARLVIWLIDQGKRVDVETALILLPALGEKHRMGPELAEVVAQAASAGFKLPNRSLEDLKRARVPLKKRSLPEELWERIKRSRSKA